MTRHLSDEAMVRMLDGEVPDAEAGRMWGHVAECGECGARVAAMRRVLAGVGEVLGAEAGPSVAARDRLERELRRDRGWGWWASGAVAAGVVLAAVFFGGLRGHGSRAGEVPDLALTPGAIRPVTLSEICSAGDEDLDPALPASTQNAVFREYGIAGAATGYQIDYLVNPQLGGTDDIRNLWPQAYRGGKWDARAKDQLEERLHQMVCDRTIDLATAQRAITTDWIGAYQKYVRDGMPRT
jgi:hypothetical protein